MSMPTIPNTRRFAAATYALPGPTICIDAGNCLGAIGKRPYCMRAANAKNAVHARQRSSGQHKLIAFTVGCRHDHDDLADAGYLRRQSVH